MNSLNLLFFTRYCQIKRTVAKAFESRLRAYVLVIAAIMFWIGIFSLFYKGFYFFSLHIPESFFGLITDHVFSLFYFSLFTMLFFSSLLIAVSLFFKNNETKFLMTHPIPHRDLFLYKLSETFLFASWAVFFLGIPVTVAYGIQQNVTLWFYPGVILSFIPYIIIPCTLGALFSFFIVLYVARYKKQLGIVLLIAIVLGIAYLIYSMISEKENAPSYTAVWLFNILGYFQFTKWPFSPSFWMSQSMFSLTHYDFNEYLLHFGLLSTSAFVLVLFSYHFANSRYAIAWSKIHSDINKKNIWKLTSLRKSLNIFFFLSKRSRLFLEKDIKIFVRDPIQWSQFAILLTLLLLYILNLRSLEYDEKSIFWREIIANLNMMAISLTACTFASRFIFPMLSLEGKRFWTLGVMPIKRWSILMAKFTFAIVILSVMTQTLVLLSGIMLRFPWQLILYQCFMVFMLTLGVAGLAVGLGAIYPNFKEDSPSKIVSGFGGTLNLVISLVYVLLTIAAQALPSHLLLTNKLPFLFYFLTIIAVTISILTTVLPLYIGIKRFNAIEI